MDDLISRQAAIDAVRSDYEGILDFTSDGHTIADSVEDILSKLPSAQSEQHEIGYSECANAMLKMWIDNVLTDGEYNRIMDKLNAHWGKTKNG